MIDHQKLLPHRGAIMLVDLVGDCQPGRAITTYKAVLRSDPCYSALPADAPPQAYAFPPPLILESFVQSGAVLWLSGANMADASEFDASAEPTATASTAEKILVFAGAKNVTFHQAVLPGDTLRHEVRVDRVIGDNVFLCGEVWVGSEIVATVGSVAAAMRPADVLDKA